MSEYTTNHTCKVCEKKYYACPDCDRRSSWRAVACSPECYKKYMSLVFEARASKEKLENEDAETQNNIEPLNQNNFNEVKTTKSARDRVNKKDK